MGTAGWYELMQGLEYLGNMLDKMWAILTTSPQSFKGGTIWSIIETINGVLGAVGTALLVLFFTIGVIKTCGSFAELKKPETAVKVFVRFAIAKALVDNCLKLLVNFVTIVQSVISSITAANPIGTALEFTIPSDVQSKFDNVGILDGAIPLWAVCFIAHIAFVVISMVLLLTVYGRFFRIYIYAAIAPLPLATLAGQPTENIGKSFLMRKTLMSQSSTAILRSTASCVCVSVTKRQSLQVPIISSSWRSNGSAYKREHIPSSALRQKRLERRQTNLPRRRTWILSL